jgi:hypothetical protein
VHNVYVLIETRLFVYLTVMAIIMVAINFTQAFLIDRYHSHVWITVVPAIVFGTMLLLLILHAIWNRNDLVRAWREVTGM